MNYAELARKTFEINERAVLDNREILRHFNLIYYLNKNFANKNSNMKLNKH